MKAHDISVRSKGQYSLITQTDFSYEATTTLAECSNRGTCNYDTGVCECYDGFRSSNGMGGNGTIPDCGFRYATDVVYTSNGTTFTTSCPVVNGEICAGNGTCNEASGVCSCNSGYGGSSCTDLTCDSSFAWFGNVDSSHSIAGDGTIECGGVGSCDKTTGKCTYVLSKLFLAHFFTQFLCPSSIVIFFF